ncbi:hypothetical protein FGE12_00355 [Aggregicoccus sp. 17bor-14]|nr:hypothetical protein [Aggregicoccus sp. 17bor-14]
MLARLAARIEALEDRVRRLERQVQGAARSAPRAAAPAEVRAQRSAGRPRPRCPGCTLELPPGRRAEACVWCGFRFDALRALEKARGPAKRAPRR